MKKLEEFAAYSEMSDVDKEATLRQLYEVEGMSWPEIAQKFGTYTNKISRDAKRLGIQTRGKDEAQKLALEKGRVEHPTKGKKRTLEEKMKIGATASKRWEELPEDEKARRANVSKERWANMTEEEKEELHRMAIEAVRETVNTGSKLENFIHRGLIENGYKVDYHTKKVIKREELEVDLLIKEFGIAIEIDGPSHFKNVWGKETFDRTLIADRVKNGLLIGAGFTLIRVQQKKNASLTYLNHLLSSLLQKIEDVKAGKHANRLIYIS